MMLTERESYKTAVRAVLDQRLAHHRAHGDRVAYATISLVRTINDHNDALERDGFTIAELEEAMQRLSRKLAVQFGSVP